MLRLYFLYRVFTKANTLIITIKSKVYYKHIFRSFGVGSTIAKPLIINNPQNIAIGNHVKILYNAWLSGPSGSKGNNSVLSIGNDSAVGNFCHIYATDQIIIENKVLIADRVYISDNLHSYKDVQLPIIDQEVNQMGRVVIGTGSWIGENVCIIGASIGKNCVIGANAVVTKDIPDYSVAVGVPAKVIRRFDHTEGEWKRIIQI